MWVIKFHALPSSLGSLASVFAHVWTYHMLRHEGDQCCYYMASPCGPICLHAYFLLGERGNLKREFERTPPKLWLRQISCHAT